jgi:hypothetical protein
LVAGGGWLVWRQLQAAKSPFSGVPPLAVADYYSNANSLRGNTYQVRAVVDDTLRFSPQSGRLISVVVKGDDGILGDPLPVQVPADLPENIQAGQEFIFKVSVGEGGLLTARELHKS